MNRWTILAILILIGGSSWIWVSRQPVESVSASEAAQETGIVLGQAAPNFSLTTLSGESFELIDLRGQPVVLNFWAMSAANGEAGAEDE